MVIKVDVRQIFTWSATNADTRFVCSSQPSYVNYFDICHILFWC